MPDLYKDPNCRFCQLGPFETREQAKAAWDALNATDAECRAHEEHLRLRLLEQVRSIPGRVMKCRQLANPVRREVRRG